MAVNIFRPTYNSTRKPLYSTAPNTSTVNGPVYMPSPALTKSAYSLNTPQQTNSSSASLVKPITPSTLNYSPVPQVSVRSPYASYGPRSGATGALPPSPQKTQPDATTNYLSKINSLADEQKAFAEKQRQQQEQYIKDSYGLAGTALDAAIPEYQSNFNQFKTNTEAGITDLQKTGEMQKGQTVDYYGDAQRQAAKNRNEVNAQNQRTFANLGTIDSTGEGSFGQATENTSSDFNRFTQQNLKAKADKLTEIDMNVSSAVRQAKAAITTEESKMNGLINQIRTAQAQNKLDEVAKLIDAYNQSQQYVLDIKDNIDKLSYAAEVEKKKLQDAIDKETGATSGLSQSFIQTGVPQNMNDFIYKTKNPSGFDSKIGANTNGQSPIAQQAVSTITKLLSQDTNPITGTLRAGGAPLGIALNGDAQYTQGLFDQLKAQLSLDNIKYLKGTGQISDKEEALLTNASTALRPGMGDQQFRTVLQDLQDQLSGGTSQASSIDPAVQAYLQANGLM